MSSQTKGRTRVEGLLVLVLLAAHASATAAQAQTLAPTERCEGQPAAAIVTFEDESLEAAVRAALSPGPRQNLTCAGLAGLTRLSAVGAGIHSLDGLQNLVGLTDLDLGSNQISDIGPLTGLTGLTSLGLYRNQITDIRPLRGLTELEDVRLQVNRELEDLRPLLENPGIGEGDRVGVGSTRALCDDLAVLASRRVSVDAVLNPEQGCIASATLPDGPFLYRTYEHPEIRVSVVARGLERPWGMAFLPDGGVLVTERPGRLRLIRDGILEPEPILGVPEVVDPQPRVAGLLDVALHPDFADNGLVYLTYSKSVEGGETLALARGRFDAHALHDVEDVFVPRTWGPRIDFAGSRIAFAPDGTLYMTVGGAFGGRRGLAQDPGSYVGKVLRLNDDGSVPDDNPFVGRPGYEPEIFSMGHRNQQGATVHPETGALWTSEHAPQGGDEVNVIVPGGNYGWPEISYAREYTGPRITPTPLAPGFERPTIVWLPSIAVTGMTFYTSDRFPAWEGNLFVGGLLTGRVWGTGHLERIALNEDGEELRREWLLADLGQRIRDVAQGRDGLLYVLTDEEDGALLRIEPVN